MLLRAVSNGNFENNRFNISIRFRISRLLLKKRRGREIFSIMDNAACSIFSCLGVYWNSVYCIADDLVCTVRSLLISNVLMISMVFTKKKNLYFTWVISIQANYQVRKLYRVALIFIAFSKHEITYFNICTVHLLLFIYYNQQCTINLLKPTGYVMHQTV